MTGAGKLNFAPLNVHEVISHVISVTQASFGRTITIERDFDPSLPDIMGDKALLIQAFLNILKNACEVVRGSRGRYCACCDLLCFAEFHLCHSPSA